MGDELKGITVRLDADKRIAFNAYCKSIGISPGNLIRNFIYRTIKENAKDKAA